MCCKEALSQTALNLIFGRKEVLELTADKPAGDNRVTKPIAKMLR